MFLEPIILYMYVFRKKGAEEDNIVDTTTIVELLEQRAYHEIKEQLGTIYPVDAASLLEELNVKQMVLVFRLLMKEEAAETFSHMNSDVREHLINALTDSELEEVMEEMYIDDTVDVLEEMPANVVDRLLMAVTDKGLRAKINMLLQYPEDSAGSIMNVDYIGLRKEMTVAEAILKIRQVGINKETIYTCYVTEKRKLIGHVDVKALLTSSDTKVIEEIMETNLLYTNTHDDKEEVANMINKYALIAIPVVDNEMCMVGIVTVDDAMVVMQEEATEDMSRMAGVAPNEESYFGTSVFQHVKNRSPWLLFLMLSATVTGVILAHYENSMLKMPLLIAFVPMLMGTGGNCGSQSSTLIIRGLALNEIEFKQILKIIWKEIRVAVIVGLFLAIVNGVRIYIMYDQNIVMAFSIGITMIAVVCLAKIIGATLPMIAYKCGLDPALMAAPLITTILDTSTIIVYFTIAKFAFKI